MYSTAIHMARIRDIFSTKDILGFAYTDMLKRRSKQNLYKEKNQKIYTVHINK